MRMTSEEIGNTASEKRNLLLSLAVGVANLFLIAFAVDAFMSFGEEIYRATFGGNQLLGLRNAIAIGVFYAAFPLLLLTAVTPPLPKRILLPPILFAIWAGIGSAPFGLWIEDAQTLAFVVVLLQCAIAVISFMIITNQFSTWFLNSTALPRYASPVLRGVVGFLLLIILFPPLLAGYSAFAFATSIQTSSGHFMRFGWEGIDAVERVYKKGDQEIRLIGMMHLGEGSAYQTLFDSFPDEAIVLTEGVSDNTGRLARDLSYQRVARVLGLDPQPAIKGGNKVKVELPSSAESDTPQSQSGVSSGSGPTIRRGDVDASVFSEETVDFLNTVTEIYGSGSMQEAFERITKYQETYGDDAIQAVFKDILDKRNDHLLGEIDKAFTDYDLVIVPWGALHMPEIEKEMLERGFVEVEENRFPLSRYGTIIEGLRTTLRGTGT